MALEEQFVEDEVHVFQEEADASFDAPWSAAVMWREKLTVVVMSKSKCSFTCKSIKTSRCSIWFLYFRSGQSKDFFRLGENQFCTKPILSRPHGCRDTNACPRIAFQVNLETRRTKLSALICPDYYFSPQTVLTPHGSCFTGDVLQCETAEVCELLVWTFEPKENIRQLNADILPAMPINYWQR